VGRQDGFGRAPAKTWEAHSMTVSNRSLADANRRMLAAIICTLVAIGAVAFSAGQSPAHAQALQQQIVTFNQKQLAYGTPFGLVWAHEVYGVRSVYGGMQVPGQARTLAAAKADGIDAVTLDCFNDASKMNNILRAGDQTGIIVAPTVDMSVLYRKKHAGADEIIQAETQTIVDYCNLAAGHNCAAKTRDGKYVIWMFGSHQLSPDQQLQALNNARSSGARFFTIGDLGGLNPSQSHADSLTRYESVWDASYEFLPLDESDAPAVKSSFIAHGRAFIDGLMPQYTRPNQRINLPPDGGARYAAMWKEAIEDRAPAVVIMTLNDTGDGSNIMPGYESETKQYAQQYKSEVLGR
jgi:hypothetical protein